MLIDRALRDEGTSYHYLPATQAFAHADPELAEHAARNLAASGLHILRGTVWTTDAPFRETVEAIEVAADKGLLAVEMEAAALYAFAEARCVLVLCLAHVTNRMAQSEGDFEKGEADRTKEALDVLTAVLQSWKTSAQSTK
jgi:purine-nucleoside phosphorylase